MWIVRTNWGRRRRVELQLPLSQGHVTGQLGLFKLSIRVFYHIRVVSKLIRPPRSVVVCFEEAARLASSISLPEMGTRTSRLQEDAVSSAFGKDGTKRDSCRRPRCTRPTSLVVDFSVSFDDTEANRSRSEEGSDSDPGQLGASADGSPADHHSIPSSIGQASPGDDDNSEGKPEEDGSVSPEAPVDAEHQQVEETGRTPHRTFSERLPGNRHSATRVGARSARVRSTHQRPVSEAWIGLYRVNNRHGSKLTSKQHQIDIIFFKYNI